MVKLPGNISFVISKDVLIQNMPLAMSTIRKYNKLKKWGFGYLQVGRKVPYQS